MITFLLILLYSTGARTTLAPTYICVCVCVICCVCGWGISQYCDGDGGGIVSICIPITRAIGWGRDRVATKICFLPPFLYDVSLSIYIYVLCMYVCIYVNAVSGFVIEAYTQYKVCSICAMFSGYGGNGYRDILIVCAFVRCRRWWFVCLLPKKPRGKGQ